jgi:hypothetical protein
MQQVYDRTRAALLALIENSLEMQERLGSSGLVARLMSTKSVLNEYCTVRCGGPRMSGHSWAIYDVSLVLAERDLSPVFIKAMSAEDGRICLDQGPDRKFRWASVSQLKDRPLAQIIFVDNAIFLRAGRRKKVEAYAMRCLERGRVVLAYVE